MSTDHTRSITIPDEELPPRLASGDFQAQQQILDQHLERLVRCISSLIDPFLRIALDPESLAQSACRTVFRQIQSGDLEYRCYPAMRELLLVRARWKLSEALEPLGAQKRGGRRVFDPASGASEDGAEPSEVSIPPEKHRTELQMPVPFSVLFPDDAGLMEVQARPEDPLEDLSAIEDFITDILPEQLSLRDRRILALKSMGFTLDEIAKQLLICRREELRRENRDEQAIKKIIRTERWDITGVRCGQIINKFGQKLEESFNGGTP